MIYYEVIMHSCMAIHELKSMSPLNQITARYFR